MDDLVRSLQTIGASARDVISILQAMRGSRSFGSGDRGVTRVEAPAGGGTDVEAAARQHTRLVGAAQQFEAMMLQEMPGLPSSSENKWDAGDKDEDKSSDTLKSYGTEALAQAISKGGGLGIAKSVVKQVTAEHDSKVKKA